MTPGQLGVTVAMLALIGVVIGAWVELRKTRVAQASIKESQRSVEHEMKPNHGGSLRDAVNKVGTHVETLDDKVDKLTARIVRVETLNEVHFGLNGRSNGE